MKSKSAAPPTNTKIERHPLSKLWPDMSDSQYKELRDDIQKHGQRYPITVYDGAIIDGWHRFRACTDLRIKPTVSKFTGTPDEAADLVNSLNAHRRNVSASERAFAITGAYGWAQACAKGEGGGTQVPPPSAKTNREMAELAGTSEKTVKRAKRVHESGSAALKEAVRKGEVPLNKAAAVVDLPKSEQLEAAKAPPEKPQQEVEPATPDLPTEDEMAELDAAAEREYHDSIAKVMDSDDRLAAANAEIKRQAQTIVGLKRECDGFMRGKSEVLGIVATRDRTISKLERRIKDLERENDSLKERVAVMEE